LTSISRTTKIKKQTKILGEISQAQIYFKVSHEISRMGKSIKQKVDLWFPKARKMENGE
jgi:hypothetical protein